MSSKPVGYMQRTRDFYRAQGFEQDYVWAHNAEIPFTKPAKPLSECTVTVVTTAVPDPGAAPKAIREAGSYEFARAPDAFDTSELAWDMETTHTKDRGSYFPLEALERLVSEGYIGKLSSRYHFVPTEYSQRLTLTKDAPATLKACQDDEVDVAILVPL
ncbi:MAG: hypothetical protein HUJ31_12450 [Pseudomonadales bacterium]|nr:hypothetical protein [Pseudomonadales bacterium]